MNNSLSPRSFLARTAPLAGAAVAGAILMALAGSAIGSAQSIESPEYRVTVSKIGEDVYSTTSVSVGSGGKSDPASEWVLSREEEYDTSLLVESRVGSGAWAPVTAGETPGNSAFFGFGE
jgi:hypothetical protein